MWTEVIISTYQALNCVWPRKRLKCIGDWAQSKAPFRCLVTKTTGRVCTLRGYHADSLKTGSWGVLLDRKKEKNERTNEGKKERKREEEGTKLGGRTERRAKSTRRPRLLVSGF